MAHLTMIMTCSLESLIFDPIDQDGHNFLNCILINDHLPILSYLLRLKTMQLYKPVRNYSLKRT